MKMKTRSNLFIGKSRHVKFAKMIGEIMSLAHLINMTTNHRVDIIMNLPDKHYQQFYLSIDTDNIGNPIFLKNNDAEKKLRGIKKRLQNILLEEQNNGKKIMARNL